MRFFVIHVFIAYAIIEIFLYVKIGLVERKVAKTKK